MILNAMSSALQGMTRNQQAFAYHADRISQWGLPDADGEIGDIDLATELLAILKAKRGFEANLPVIRAADEMLGTLIDTFA